MGNKWKALLRAFIAVACLAGCSSPPPQTDADNFNEIRLPLTLVAVCPTYSPTPRHVIDLLHERGISVFGISSGQSRLLVADSNAPSARKILSQVVNDDKFKGLKVIE